MFRFLLLGGFAVLLAGGAGAQEPAHPGGKRPDDRVIFDISAEDWITSGTARVAVAVEAAVTSGTAGTMRADMLKAVNELAQAEWRLTSFDRSQDQTGMERWSAGLEARLPETRLSGLGDTVKKLSKAGMQLSIAAIDFSPTLQETEAARSALRVQIYKIANDQLTALGAALPGRTYRIAEIDFTGEDEALPMPRVIKGHSAVAMMAPSPVAAEAGGPLPIGRAEKIVLTARVVLAAQPETGKPVVPAAPLVLPELKR
ncbi:MAG: hypothetical protein AB7H77_09855 [Bdellovibrionales bacterium]